jgi:hypothetical protein
MQTWSLRRSNLGLICDTTTTSHVLKAQANILHRELAEVILSSYVAQDLSVFLRLLARFLGP